MKSLAAVAGTPERHRIASDQQIAARGVLGANGGLLSTSSLVLGAAAAHGSHSGILVTGISGLDAGSMSMAVGE